MTNGIVQNAIECLTKGLSVFPLRMHGKRPSGPWEQYQERRASLADAAIWHANNLGIVTGAISNVVVVDCESEEDARWFLTYRSAGLTPAIASTPRGFHLYYQHPGERVKNAIGIEDERGNRRYDVRGDGGYVVAPPSIVTTDDPDVKVAGRYEWLRPIEATEQLPFFRTFWRPRSTDPAAPQSTPRPNAQNGRLPANDGNRRIVDGAAYIKHIHAISGQGGHNETYRAVCRLRDSGLDELAAFAVLADWNETNAQPPWSERELLHKVKSCYSQH